MSRNMIGVLLVALAAVAWATGACASTISLNSEESYAIPYTGDPFDITAAGNLDWVVSYYAEKAGATAIVTTPPGNTAEFESSPAGGYYAGAGFPTFSWTDGSYQPTIPFIGGDGLIFGDGVGTGVGTHIAVPAGSGTLTVWWAYAVVPGPAAFTVTFDDSTSYTTPGTSGALKTVLNYNTDTAQTLTFQTNPYAGVFAMAVSTVPEPGTLVLLGLGLVGLSAYAWRKRK
jgi:hypothetical protein